MFSHDRFFGDEPLPVGSQHILGMAGFWVVRDEAHVITIAVREAYRRWGIGELLFMSLIDKAVKLNARMITLEVRASNMVAQALYERYGFVRTGVRRGYYMDNKEDAVLMIAKSVKSASFQARFQELKRAYGQRWEVA